MSFTWRFRTTTFQARKSDQRRVKDLQSAIGYWVPCTTLNFLGIAWSVWLAARNNIWTWPIGLANSVFFVVLFWDARLFFDMSLNVFYVVTGLWGWGVWAIGGERRTQKPIQHIERREALLVLGAVIGVTLGMWQTGVFIARLLRSVLLPAAPLRIRFVAHFQNQ